MCYGRCLHLPWSHRSRFGQFCWRRNTATSYGGQELPQVTRRQSRGRNTGLPDGRPVFSMPAPQTVTSLACGHPPVLSSLTLSDFGQVAADWRPTKWSSRDTDVLCLSNIWNLPSFPFPGRVCWVGSHQYSEWSCLPHNSHCTELRVPVRTRLSHEHLYGLLQPPPTYRNKTLLPTYRNKTLLSCG